MIFCGQCGLQLAPGTKRCPRCGTFTDADAEPNVAIEDLNTNDPTMASLHHFDSAQQPFPSAPSQPAPPQAGAPYTAGPFTPVEQQKLILRPENADYDYDVQGANEATSMMNAPTFGAPRQASPSSPSYQPNTDYPGDVNYAIPTSYPSGGNYPPYQAPYQGFVPPGGAAYQPNAVRPYQQSRHRGRGGIAVLVLVLFGLLLITGALSLYAAQHTNLFSRSGNGAASTTPASSSPVDQAKAIVEQYYAAVNNKNYQRAYHLWKQGPTKNLEKFKAGYANTLHDDLTIENADQQNDGTVKVSLTVNADERTSSGTQKSIYKGYYIVGQQSDGSWKILSGILNKI